MNIFLIFTFYDNLAIHWFPKVDFFVVTFVFISASVPNLNSYELAARPGRLVFSGKPGEKPT